MTVAKYIPLTFVTSDIEKERLIRNTILLRHFSLEAQEEVELAHYIEGTQYGFNASAVESGTNRFVRISDISNGEIDWDSVPFCECDKPEGYLLRDHDLIVARTGGTTGKSYMVKSPPKDSIFAGYLIRIRANEDTNPSFLSVFLNSYFYWAQITSLNRDEFRPSVNAKKLSALRLPKLDRNSQNKIADLASSIKPIDASIASEVNAVVGLRRIQDAVSVEMTHQQALLGKLKQAILHEAIQGKLTADWRAANPDIELASQLLQRIQDEKGQLIVEKKIRKEKRITDITPEEIPFEIPDGWEWCRWGQLNLDYSGGAAYKSNEVRDSGDNQVIRIGNIKPNTIDLTKRPAFLSDQLANETSRNEIFVGDFLFTMTGTYKKRDYCFSVLVGEEHFQGIRLFQNQRVGRFRTHPDVNREFLIKAIKLDSLLDPVFASSTGAANQANISKDSLMELLIPLPPIAEQAVIVERVDALMANCRELEDEIEHSQSHAADLLQAILKDAFSSA